MLLPKRATTLLVNKSTPFFSLAYKLLPNRIESVLLDYLMNTLSKEFIDNNELDFINDKFISISIPDIAIHWTFTKTQEDNPKDDRLVLVSDKHIKSDVNISGTLNAMILMASQKVDPDTLFFNRELTITGDTNLGLEVKNLIDQFNINLLGGAIKKSLDFWSQSIIEVRHAERSIC